LDSPPNLQPSESEIVDAVFQSEKSIRGEPVESCKLRYFNSFEFFDHTRFELIADVSFEFKKGDNQLLGGTNKTQGNFGFGFPIVGATVEVDGKVVIKDGKLRFE
jgi:hypothetical protein